VAGPFWHITRFPFSDVGMNLLHNLLYLNYGKTNSAPFDDSGFPDSWQENAGCAFAAIMRECFL
jgi:hypothetical protein